MPTPFQVHRSTHFVLWRPGVSAPAPRLVIGIFHAGAPPTLLQRRELVLMQSPVSADLFELPLAACGLADGVYHYWFALSDADVYGSLGTVQVTDPCATCVDWRLTATPGGAPASVVRVRGGRLETSDSDVAPVAFTSEPDVPLRRLPINRQLVIYELPTAWARHGAQTTTKEVGVGTFEDVRHLVMKTGHSSLFTGIAGIAGGRYLLNLGINALELLPPADSLQDRSEWGYGTANYFAPDFDLGRPAPAQQAAKASAVPSHAVTAMLQLVRACHAQGVRVFYDAVMAFSNGEPYRHANFLDFHVWWNSGDPEQQARDGFGGDLWKYGFETDGYDPLSGQRARIFPARQHMIGHLLHWMEYYHLDGLRLDSVNNFGSWDFAGDVRDRTRAAWVARTATGKVTQQEADERFLVIGEELSVPKGLLGRLDALWNEDFKRAIRQLLLGRTAAGEPSFEWAVRKTIDCRLLGFARGDQAVNYLCSHDVGGMGNERLFNFLDNNQVGDKARRVKLGFACLLTAVGIPMILAGEEFAEQHDYVQLTDTNKQIDPVNYDRLGDVWRKEVFAYVARLVHFRTSNRSLWSDDIAFLHVDFTDGKRVVVWQRGSAALDGPVVVVANFSDWGTADPGSPGARYVVNHWPATPAGQRWQEITQDRPVAEGWAGQEPLFPWEAKVYHLRPPALPTP